MILCLTGGAMWAYFWWDERPFRSIETLRQRRQHISEVQRPTSNGRLRIGIRPRHG